MNATGSAAMLCAHAEARAWVARQLSRATAVGPNILQVRTRTLTATLRTECTAPDPEHRRYHHPTARASTGRLTRRAPSPATPAPARQPYGRHRRLPSVNQGNERTPTLARAQAADAHTQAHVFARTSLAGAGYGGRRGGGQGGATRGRRAQHRHVRRPNTRCV